MKQKTRDNLIYLSVALAIATCVATYVFYTDRSMGRIPVPPRSVLWGILSTPAVVALVLQGFWKYRRRPALWLILVVVAAVNVSVVAIAYSRGWNPPVLVWSTLTGLSMIPIFVVTSKILGNERGGSAENSVRSRPTRSNPLRLRGKRRG